MCLDTIEALLNCFSFNEENNAILEQNSEKLKNQNQYRKYTGNTGNPFPVKRAVKLEFENTLFKKLFFINKYFKMYMKF